MNVNRQYTTCLYQKRQTLLSFYYTLQSTELEGRSKIPLSPSEKRLPEYKFYFQKLNQRNHTKSVVSQTFVQDRRRKQCPVRGLAQSVRTPLSLEKSHETIFNTTITIVMVKKKNTQRSKVTTRQKNRSRLFGIDYGYFRYVFLFYINGGFCLLHGESDQNKITHNYPHYRYDHSVHLVDVLSDT